MLATMFYSKQSLFISFISFDTINSGSERKNITNFILWLRKQRYKNEMTFPQALWLVERILDLDLNSSGVTLQNVWLF